MSGVDSVTKKTPATWRANATNIDLGSFNGDAPNDLTGHTAITLNIRPDQTMETNLASKTIAVPASNTITQSGWDNGSEQHATFEFNTAEMNLALSGETQKKFWLVVTALDPQGEETTLGTSWFIVVEDNNATAGPPPENPGAALTQDVADTIYMPKEAWRGSKVILVDTDVVVGELGYAYRVLADIDLTLPEGRAAADPPVITKAGSIALKVEHANGCELIGDFTDSDGTAYNGTTRIPKGFYILHVIGTTVVLHGEKVSPDDGFKRVPNPDGGLDLALWNQDQDIYQRIRLTGAPGSEGVTIIT